ncbi:MAG TPA: VWA domain-containing protein [Myxococcales bacterium]|nr:VWA domain-containing protein [Myxococcales bacterium]
MSGAWRFTLLGYQAGFAQPLLLLLALAGAAAGGLGIFLALRRRDALKSAIADRLLDQVAPGLSVARPVVRASLHGAGLLLLAVALAQPQCGTKSELTKRRGIDVVVALDASKSMLARDVQPDRLERAKVELLTLLDELKGDRVGLVVFAGDAFIQCPLTSDYAAAKLFLKAVDPTNMPQGGTNIGAALTLAKQVLEGADRGAKDRVVVLLSDGEDVFGEVQEGVDALKELGVKVYSLGIGSEQGEPIPVTGRNGEHLGFQKDEEGNTVLTRLDPRALRDIAEATGGELFYQPHGVAMTEVVQRIDQMQKSELESRISVRYDERYQAYALPGIGLVLAGMALRPSRRRARP